MSKIKYLGCALGKSSTDAAESHRKVACRRKVAGAMKSLVNDRGLHEGLLMPVLLNGSEIIIWREQGLGLGLCRWGTSEV